MLLSHNFYNIADLINMLRRSLFLISVPLLISSCALLPEPHRIEITQGNIIEESAVSQLKLGMTEEQVKFLLGTPALRDIFHPDRWDYIHYVDRQNEELINEKLTLFFSNGLLQKVSSSDFDTAHLLPHKSPETGTQIAPVATTELSTLVTPTSIEENAAPTSSETRLDKTSQEQEIENTVSAWATAWSNQDVSSYIASYIEGYSPEGKTHSAWAKLRKSKLTRPKSINVELSQIQTQVLDENTARVEFVQSYQSNTYKDKVLKELSLQKHNQKWLISWEKTLKTIK